MSAERPPTRDELLAMAFVDGELEEGARLEFEQRLAREPALAREVVALRRLELVARSLAPPEPQDHEWQQLEREPLQRALSWGAALLVGGGLLGLAAAGLWLALRSDLGLAWKILLGATAAGLPLAVLAALRWRWRTRPFDPYTHVRR